MTSDISGRGVGMDVVRTKIRELGGEVLMDSVPGQGTSAQIRLPLTLAIVSALQVDVAGAPFAIPIDRVERTLRLGEHTVRADRRPARAVARGRRDPAARGSRHVRTRHRRTSTTWS